MIGLHIWDGAEGVVGFLLDSQGSSRTSVQNNTSAHSGMPQSEGLSDSELEGIRNGILIQAVLGS